MPSKEIEQQTQLFQDALKSLAAQFPKIEIPELTSFPAFNYLDPINYEVELPNPEDTIMGAIDRKIEDQIRLANTQITLLSDQNRLLVDNYNKLKEMYDAQAANYKAAQDELRRTRKHNIIMMVIAAVAMLAAIAGPIVTVLLS